MTRKLEELLNISDNEKEVKQQKASDAVTAKNHEKKEQEENLKKTKLAELDKISTALPPVSGLGMRSDKELDSITNQAISSYEELMDLGMNVETRYAGRLFEVANSMLKTGLDARIAKLESKLKMVDLQLKKEKLEQDAKRMEKTKKVEVKETKKLEENKDYVVTDRNSLMEKLKSLNETSEKTNQSEHQSPEQDK